MNGSQLDVPEKIDVKLSVHFYCSPNFAGVCISQLPIKQIIVMFVVC